MGFIGVFSGIYKGSIRAGSWVVRSRVISRITIVISHIRGLTTPLITTHEPPSAQAEGQN